jgi:hypothetical protein
VSRIVRPFVLIIVALLAISDSLPVAHADPRTAREPCRLCQLPDRIRNDPSLLERGRNSPHALFRLINLEFSQSLCDRFAASVASMPSVNLHGDAHVEQYAVTLDSAGLIDFDDSSSGPAVIDLARFTASLLLACEQRDWLEDAEKIVDRFFEGYRAALRDPTIEVAEPELALRVRSGFGGNTLDFLSWAESIMIPLPEPRRAEIEAGYARYVERMLRLHPELDAAFFELKTLGGHELGLGSARDVKVIGRIEGPSPAPADDLILEGKELRDLGAIACVSARRGDALRVVLAQQRISERGDPFLAVVPRGAEEAPDDPPFWVQSWSPEYAELDIDQTLESVLELGDVAFDVGVQLGRGHTNQIASPFDSDLREAQLRALHRHEAAIRHAAAELALSVTEIWQSIVSESDG